MPRAGINVKKPWRGWFWIFSKGRFDTTPAIQGRSSTRVLDESLDWSWSSRSCRSFPGEDEPGACLISDEHSYSYFKFIDRVLVQLRRLSGLRLRLYLPDMSVNYSCRLLNSLRGEIEPCLLSPKMRGHLTSFSAGLMPM